jgi:hypothetical protein
VAKVRETAAKEISRFDLEKNSSSFNIDFFYFGKWFDYSFLYTRLLADEADYQHN